MKGQLIIHIGPPKTATTSLQYYWHNMKYPSNFEYLGVKQPREANSMKDDLYKNISSDNEMCKNEITDTINKKLKKNKYVVISEEMFLFESPKISYKESLIKLFDVTKSFEPIIIFGVRSVEQVYFSYFVEMYNILPFDIQSSFKNFQNSSYCDCYKYEKLYNTLLKIGFKKIHVFYFKKLISGQLTMNEILGIEDLDYNFKVILKKENVTVNKNKDLKLLKKNSLKVLIKKNHFLIPNILKRNKIGKKLSKWLSKKKQIKLKKELISQESKNIYKRDLLFLKSL